MINVTFANNSAPYGNNIASYAVKAILTDGEIENFEIDNAASGQEYEEEIRFALVDYDNQTIDSQTSGLMTINAVSENASALGLSSTSIVNGISTFKNVIFQAKPGSTNVEFTVRTFSIDSSLISRVFNTSTLQESFFVNFRLCKPGEADESNQ